MTSNIQVSSNSDHPLKASGRFGRLSYAAWLFLSTLIIVLIMLVIGFCMSLVINTSTAISILFGVFLVILYGILLYLQFVFSIRRLHDRNQSGWLSLLMLVPLVNLILMIYLFCAKGTDGENNYGPQRETASWERILGWLYIIVFPLLIVFAIVGNAIPAYQAYIQHSQSFEMQNQQYETE